MGFLESGVSLEWDESEKAIAIVKRDGIKQLINLWTINATREDYDLKWGDEVEYCLVKFDHKQKKAVLSLEAPELLAQLKQREANNDWPEANRISEAANALCNMQHKYLRSAEWHPEFGNHMIECTPNPPYDMDVDSLLEVEDSLVSRRFKLQSILPENVFVTSLSGFPHLGHEDFYENFTHTNGLEDEVPSPHSSLTGFMGAYAPVVNPHPRFPTLVRNLCARRGATPSSIMPIFLDRYTDKAGLWDLSEDLDDLERKDMASLDDMNRFCVKDNVYLNHFGMGMSLSCLQTTYGAKDLSSARFLYDQMAVLAPIFLALSAAMPFIRGALLNTDTRWHVLEQTCDDRKDAETEILTQSRYGSVQLFIGDSDYLRKNLEQLNDLQVPIDHKAYCQLREANLDPLMARHFASLWVRDPLVIFKDRLHLDNKVCTDHFENLQSTNWNSVRFKPPPASVDGVTKPKIGWRVELRTPDLQLSDFANAALCALSTLITMGVLKYKWNFYIPISLVKENMETAFQRQAAQDLTFHFRHSIDPLAHTCSTCRQAQTVNQHSTKGGSVDPVGGTSPATVSSPNSPAPLDSSKRLRKEWTPEGGVSGKDAIKTTPLSSYCDSVGETKTSSDACVNECVCRMSLREIFLGSQRSGFPGLVTMLNDLVSEEWRAKRCSRAAVEKYRLYINFLEAKATGQTWTDAKLLRHLVRTNPDYKGTSEISNTVNYDICKFAVLAGFSLCPQVSPWGMVTCLPSSTRLKTASINGLDKLAHSHLVGRLTNLLVSGSEPAMKQISDQVISIMKEDDCQDSTTASNDARLQPTRNTWGQMDADLFLEVDRFSC